MVVCLCVLLVYEMRVVGTNHLYPILLCQFKQHLVGFLLQWERVAVGTYCRVFYLVSLQLKVVVVSKHPFVPFYRLPCTFNVVGKNLAWHLTGNTSRAYYQVFVVFLQFCPVGTRTSVESVNPCIGHQFYKVLVSPVVLCKNNEMVTSPVAIVFVFVFFPMSCHIHLTSEDRLERLKSFFFSSTVHLIAIVEELFNAKHVAMIGHRHALHSVGHGFVYEFCNT